MADKKAQAEYLRRNQLHAAAAGVHAGIEKAIERLEAQNRPPQWLVGLLRRELDKQERVVQEMVAHRDEVYEKAWKDAF